MSVLKVALDPSTVIVAVDPGKAFNRVWISNGSGAGYTDWPGGAGLCCCVRRTATTASVAGVSRSGAIGHQYGPILAGTVAPVPYSPTLLARF